MITRTMLALACAASLGLAVDARAQDAPAAAPAAPPAAPQTPVVIQAPVAGVLPKNTLVAITVTEVLGSDTHKRGDRFTIKLAAPILLDGQVVVPAGTPGVGEVIHAAPKGMGGRPGEILIAARYLDFQGVRIPLKGFQLSAGGRDLAMASLWAGALIQGSNTQIPVGAGGPAKLAQDVVFDPAAPQVQPAPAPPAPGSAQ